MKINDEVILDIQDIGVNGEGVAFLNNKPVFVPFCLPTEKVQAVITKITDKYYIAKLTNVLIKSNNRIEPLCPYFYQCGGCSLQHLDYENQLKFKTNLVKQNIKKYANIDAKILPCISSENTYFYRNKLEFKIGKKSDLKNSYKLGFYKLNSNCIVPLITCKLCESWVDNVILCLNNYIKFVTENSKYYANFFDTISSVVVRYLGKNLTITFVTKSKQFLCKDFLINQLKIYFKNFNLLHNINTTSFQFGKTFKVLHGSISNNYQTLSVNHKISADSFVQVNEDIQNKIYKQVLNEVSTNANIVDAYSGAGLLSAIISKKAKKVLAVEIIENAVNDAKILLQNNGITNVEAICGDCAKILPKLLSSDTNYQVILDPPRSGCDKNIVDALSISTNIEKIIYISCASTTLARDLKILMQNGKYKIKYIQPFDMFPQTSHIETLLVLEKV